MRTRSGGAAASAGLPDRPRRASIESKRGRRTRESYIAPSLLGGKYNHPVKDIAAQAVQQVETKVEQAKRGVDAAVATQKAKTNAIAATRAQKYQEVLQTTQNPAVVKAAKQEMAKLQAAVAKADAATELNAAKAKKAVDAAAGREKSVIAARAKKAIKGEGMAIEQRVAMLTESMDWGLNGLNTDEISQEFAAGTMKAAEGIKPSKNPKFIVYYGGDAFAYLDAIASENGLQRDQVLTIEPMALIRAMPQFNLALAKIVASYPAGTKAYTERISAVALAYGAIIGQKVVEALLTDAFSKKFNVVLALDATTLTRVDLIGDYNALAKEAGFETSLFFPAVDAPTMQHRLDLAYAPINKDTGARFPIAWDLETVQHLSMQMNSRLEALYPYFNTTTVVRAPMEDDGKEIATLMRIEINAKCSEEVKDYDFYKATKRYAGICTFMPQKSMVPLKRMAAAQRTFWQNHRGKLLAGAALLALGGVGGLAYAGYLGDPAVILKLMQQGADNVGASLVEGYNAAAGAVGGAYDFVATSAPIDAIKNLAGSSANAVSGAWESTKGLFGSAYNAVSGSASAEAAAAAAKTASGFTSAAASAAAAAAAKAAASKKSWYNPTRYFGSSDSLSIPAGTVSAKFY